MLGPCNFQSSIVKHHDQSLFPIIRGEIHLFSFYPLLLFSWSLGVFKLHDLTEIKAVVLTTALENFLFGLHLKRVELRSNNQIFLKFIKLTSK